MLTLDKIYHASYVLKDVIRPTHIVKAEALSNDCHVYLKPENLQITGSFKVRGSGYKISQLSDEEKARGVIACSAGNHAQGVALAATKYGIKSLICLPDGAPISKVEATKGYGAEVCMVPGVYDDAYNKALELRDEKNYTFIHPFDDENVIAGQGTIGIEILNEMPDVDAVIAAIGGGGLLSGVACAIKNLNPNIKVYGVQAEGAPSMYESIKQGKPVSLDKVSTIADGIQVKEPGEHTFEYLDVNEQRIRKLRAVCSQKSQGSTPRYVMLYNLDEKKEEVPDTQRPKVFIRTFGYFDVFVGEKPVVFRNRKAKELLALLTDRRGGFVTSEEAVGFLWEDEPVTPVTLARYRKVALRLKNTLESAGIGYIVESVSGSRRLVPEAVRCDLYDYLSGNPRYASLFKGG